MSHIVRSLRKVGEHFGRTLRTAQRWRRAGMPKCSAGYDLEQCADWLRARAGSGASLREMERQVLVEKLFDLAVVELRRGLQHLCASFVKARGKGRARLIDRAVRDILRGAHHQQSLLEGEGGARPPGDDSPKGEARG